MADERTAGAIKYTREWVDKLHSRLLLDIYHEFCFKQRSQAMWDAGFETMEKLGQAVKLNQKGGHV